MRISDWSSDVCSSDLDGSGCRRSARGASRRSAGRGHRDRDARPATVRGTDRRVPAGGARQPVKVTSDQILFSVKLFIAARSAEHTSELQLLMRISYAVFCLKKKKLIINTTQHPTIHHTIL